METNFSSKKLAQNLSYLINSNIKNGIEFNGVTYTGKTELEMALSGKKIGGILKRIENEKQRNLSLDFIKNASIALKIPMEILFFADIEHDMAANNALDTSCVIQKLIQRVENGTAIVRKFKREDYINNNGEITTHYEIVNNEKEYIDVYRINDIVYLDYIGNSDELNSAVNICKSDEPGIMDLDRLENKLSKYICAPYISDSTWEKLIEEYAVETSPIDETNPISLKNMEFLLRHHKIPYGIDGKAFITTNEEFSKKFGVTTSYFSIRKKKTNNKEPKAEHLCLLSTLCDITVDTLAFTDLEKLNHRKLFKNPLLTSLYNLIYEKKIMWIENECDPALGNDYYTFFNGEIADEYYKEYISSDNKLSLFLNQYGNPEWFELKYENEVVLSSKVDKDHKKLEDFFNIVKTVVRPAKEVKKALILNKLLKM